MVFIISYYYDNLKLLIKPLWPFGVIIILAGLLLNYGLIKKDKTELCINNNQPTYRLMVVRDTILQNDINVTLGRIQNGCFKNELVLIRSELDMSFKINDILLVHGNLKNNINKSNPFDMIFFGKVNYQFNFETIQKIDHLNKISLSTIISMIRDKIDYNIKSTVGLKNYNLVSM